MTYYPAPLGAPQSFTPATLSPRKMAKQQEATRAGQLAELSALLDRQEMAVEAHAGKVAAIVSMTCAGIQGVGVISAVELAVARTVPHAAQRVVTLAEYGAVALGQSVLDAARRLK